MKKTGVFIYGMLGGMCVAIGEAAFLSVNSKPLGALFFTVGLFVICTFGFNLFTGKICYVFDNGRTYALDCAIIWFGNLLGAWLTGMAFRATRISPLAEKAASLCQVKFDDSLWSVFILAVFCNILIFVAVDGYRNNPHELGKYLSLFFGVTVFIICGFEHCVANMFYISMAGLWSGQAVAFILVNTVGNALGGVLIPLVRRSMAKKSAVL